MALARRQRNAQDIWPGFVDALASLLMVIIFLLMVFVVSQVTLNEALVGRDRQLEDLNTQVAELAEMLGLEQRANADLRENVASLSQELSASLARREALEGELATLSAARADLASRLEQAEGTLGVAQAALTEAEAKVEADRETIEAQRSELARLERDLLALTALREQLMAELEDAQQDILARDLALEAREVLGDRSGIQIVGDRFVFQSEVLFAAGSDALGVEGQAQMAQLAETLVALADEIPPDIDWILRVDGHTDRVPIATARFPSNWELSTARAISVVKFLIDAGIPAERLAATGFGEYQPLDPANTIEAFRRNRRIELKFDQR